MAQYPDISRFPSGLSKDRFRFFFQQEFDKLNPSNTNFNQTDYDNRLKRSWSTYSVNLSDSSDDNNNRNSNTNDVGNGRRFTGGIMDFFGKAFQTQEKKEFLPDIRDEMIDVKDIMDTILDTQGNLNKLSVIGENVLNNLGGQIELYYEQQTALINRVNVEAGLTGDLAKNFREELTNANPRLLQLGIGFDELAQAAKTAFEESGRFNLINQQTLERAGEIALAYVGKLDDLISMYDEFEKVGLGAANAQERIAAAGKEATGLGLRAKNVTSELSKNLKELNNYGFKNGVDGLSSMVRKATEFRMSIGEAFKIAENVMDPDKAIELSANLQVLGGAIGDFNDPLKLMYMATNNVEGLQDALIDAAKGLATYNSEQGRFELTGVNLRRAREMAKQLGVDYGELAKGAIAAAERTSASADLMARGLKLDKQQEEFITNLAQMKDGKMVIEIGSSASLKEYFKGQSTVKLEELTQEQVNKLMEYQDTLKDMSEEDIVKQQASSIENMKRDVNYIAALLRTQAGRIGETVVMETLARTTGMSLAELEKEFSKFTQGQTEDIKTLRDKFVQQTTELIGSAKSGFNKVSEDNKKTPSQNNQNKPTPPVVNVQTKVEEPKTDINKGPVDDSGKAITELNKNINQNINPTQQTQTNANLKTNEQKNENNKFFSDFEKTYGSINKDNEKPLTLDINRDKPLNVSITDESITKLTKNEVKPLINEPKNVNGNVSNNFLSGFEKTYGSINKGNEQSIVKVNPQNIETQKNIDLQKAISEQNQKSSLVKNTDEQKSIKEGNESVATVVHKHIIEMKIMPQGPIVDQMARYLYSNPSFVEGLVNPESREFTTIS